MNCPHCGAELPENATTCQSCSFEFAPGDDAEAVASAENRPQERRDAPAPEDGADNGESHVDEAEDGDSAVQEESADAESAMGSDAPEEAGDGDPETEGDAAGETGDAGDADSADAGDAGADVEPDIESESDIESDTESEPEAESDAEPEIEAADGIPDEEGQPVGMKVKFAPFYDEDIAKGYASSFDADPDAEQGASPFVSLASAYGTIADGGDAARDFALQDDEPIDPAGNTLPAPAPRVQEPERKRRIKPVAAVLIVAVIAVAAIAGIVVWNHLNQPETVAYTGNVEVTLDIPGYDEGSSPAPIKVSGTAAATQEPVFETFLLTPGNNKIPLGEGQYHFAAEGSPVTSGGIIFSIPRESHTVTITAEGIEVDGKPSAGPTFSYSAMPAENVTDQGIGMVREWMAAAGLPQETIDSYIGSISKARGDRLTQIEEEKKAAAEAKEAANRAADLKERVPDYGIAKTLDAASFSFGLPSAWNDRVAYEVYSGGNQSLVVVYLTGNRSLKMLEIAKYPIADGKSFLLHNAAIEAGAESGYVPGNGEVEFTDDGAEMTTVSTWDNGDYRFEVTTCEWPAHFARDMGYMGCTDDQRNTLMLMSTGNRFTYDDLAFLEDSYYAGMASDLVKNVVIPSIQPGSTFLPSEEAAPEAEAAPEQ